MCGVSVAEMQQQRRGESLSSSPLPPRLLSVKESWQQTPEARGYINLLLKRNKRKTFGERERGVANLNFELSSIQECLRSLLSRNLKRFSHCTRSSSWLENLVLAKPAPSINYQEEVYA